MPGYTYVTNGENVGVEDQGPGYYQPEDPEHSDAYLDAIRSDCFSAQVQTSLQRSRSAVCSRLLTGGYEQGEPARDHSNCAALLKHSHTYPNADPFRFSGVFPVPAA